MEPTSNQLQQVSKNLPALQTKQKEIFLIAASKISNRDVAPRIIEASYETKLVDVPLASSVPGQPDVIDMVTQMRIMVGQNKDVTTQQLEVEARFLQNNYRAYSISDLQLALELFLNNRLDIELPTYVTFSPLFIAHVMNAYIRYRQKTMKEVEQLSDRPMLMLEQSDKEQRVQGLKDCIKECYAHERGGFVERFYNDMVLELLIRTGRLNITDELFKAADKYAEAAFLKDRTANRDKKRQKHKHDVSHIGEAIKTNPAGLYPGNRQKAEEVYRQDYFLMYYFKNNKLNSLIDSITETDLKEK